MADKTKAIDGRVCDDAIRMSYIVLLNCIVGYLFKNNLELQICRETNKQNENIQK